MGGEKEKSRFVPSAAPTANITEDEAPDEVGSPTPKPWGSLPLAKLGENFKLRCSETSARVPRGDYTKAAGGARAPIYVYPPEDDADQLRS